MKTMLKISLITVSVLVGLIAWADDNNSDQQTQTNQPSAVQPSTSTSNPSAASPALQEEHRPCGLAPGEPVTNCPAAKTAEETEGDTALKPGGNKNPDVKSNVLVTSVGQNAQKVSQPLDPVKDEGKKSSSEK